MKSDLLLIYWFSNVFTPLVKLVFGVLLFVLFVHGVVEKLTGTWDHKRVFKFECFIFYLFLQQLT